MWVLLLASLMLGALNLFILLGIFDGVKRIVEYHNLSPKPERKEPS